MTIPYGHQDITQADIDAVVGVLRSDFLTQGPAVTRFEKAVSEYVGAKHGVAVNSATAGLHVACLALGLTTGDVLWTVPNTFVASANCARYCGADVDFVDIDPHTWNMSVPALRAKLERASASGRLPKVVVPVHFGGQPTEQELIWELAEQYGFRVLEDASHSIGAARHAERVGSCKWSDATVFSFHPVKIITTGEGGLVVTNNAELARRMELYRSHGITRDPAQFVEQPTGPWYYEQQSLGFNYRMTDIQAALGTSQLTRVDAYVARRNALAAKYDESLRDVALALPHVAEGNLSSFHLYAVRLRAGARKVSQRQVVEALRSAGVGANLHYMPVHLQPYYRELGFKRGQFPEAEAYGREAFTLPLYPLMTDDDQQRVITVLRGILAAAQTVADG
jgi:UDP-4-amino-4,6-dideoxy-N-acetyl-beta-L-altrosamine transaminase